MGAAGVAASFLPHEILRAAGIEPAGLVPVLVQLLGATYFAFAMVDWTARGSLIGGIYNRPVAIGNLTHFVVGAFALAKTATSQRSGVVVVAALVYVVLAVAFVSVFFRSPVTADRADAR
jgi:hypothetical protein